MKFLLALVVLVAGAWAQDTYYCPDGWFLEEDRSGCRCFMLSGGEMVTKDDADILCAFHEGWVGELDHPGINYWLKSKLLANTEPGEFHQFWLGATTEGHHDPDHDQGVWNWPHMGTQVDWFDWARGQPNDYKNENCLALMEFHDPFFPNQRDYFWNDYHCDSAANYICEKTCNTY
eukprot:TRINITY_DN447_c0_g1_i10.p1 TRINITY_DN447_c0_g1~~TRINITY_DN447_c0_g1_i10.p1  ORF type:complete len:176 (-),score=45.65 TRINITY_DN447_c0_g1_i10:51-578(-)